MWNIYPMDCYSVIKNEIMSFARKWTRLEIIMLSRGAEIKKPNIT
jgi:hypothetical protein